MHPHRLNHDGTCDTCARIAEREASYAHDAARLFATIPNTDDVRVTLGDRGNHAGRSYAWHACARHAGAYNVAPTGTTVPIPRKGTTNLRASASDVPTIALDYCDRCGGTRDDVLHAYSPDTGTYRDHRYTPARATVALGDARTRTVDVHAWIAAYDAQRSRLGPCVALA